jgi:hypothetical protein
MVLLLGACASPPTGHDVNQSAWAAQGRLPVASPAASDALWHERAFPGKRATEYRPTHKAGRPALWARADASASAMRREVHLPAEAVGRLQFSWYVSDLLEAADLSQRGSGDSPVRIVLAFDGDRRHFSARDQLLSELSQALTGEPMPYATLMYVWCNRCAANEVITHPRTGRIRKIAVESGSAGIGRWRDHERDLRADFERAFGEPPGPLLGVALMTDSDNTRSTAQAWYGPLRLLEATTARQP